MRIPQRRYIITIQSKGEVEDEWGGVVDDWTPFCRAWAKKKYLSGREIMSAQAAQSETTVRFWTRYIPGVDTSMRIEHKGEHFDIIAVIPVKEGTELEFHAKTGANNG
ncbi:phage head closure protein [Desulfobulbus rhabdoformis]|uniref:phage head closure protein n=1 Tax=Desulfobulbus rhabdoformis TaxID=34032 RepID=UPI0019647FE9|nr:phage head closure protein [Desulfobulbus rhabdoformis]